MKVTKEQLEKIVLEAVQAEMSQLNEEELEELLGGLKGMFGGAAQGIARGASAVGGAVKGAAQGIGGAIHGAGQAVVGQAQKAGQAIKGAAGAVKGAYNVGELNSNLGKAKDNLANVAKLIQQFGGDPSSINAMVKQVDDLVKIVGQELTATGKRTSQPPQPPAAQQAFAPTQPQSQTSPSRAPTKAFGAAQESKKRWVRK